MLKKKYILNITPQTNVRATQGDKIFFRIPREKLYKSGLARLQRLERYNEYKIENPCHPILITDEQVEELYRKFGLK